MKVQRGNSAKHRMSGEFQRQVVTARVKAGPMISCATPP
jgi:hypothetical protein